MVVEISPQPSKFPRPAKKRRKLATTPAYVKYQSTSVEQTEEAKPINLGPLIAPKAHRVTSPQRDFA